ncbi:MAG: WD40 repeat domain-containing protein, partial [Rhodopila sp.]
MHLRIAFGFKTVLLSATLLGVSPGAWADGAIPDANSGQVPLPTGQFITPTFATGSSFSVLSPDIREYTPSVGNYPNFHPDGAIASTLSPDGKTLAVMTSGYNTLDDKQGNLLGNGAEFVILYDVSSPRAPAKKQTLRPPNTFVGLAFSPDGKTLYVSGGNDDQVLIYTQSGGQFAQSGTIPLGHNKIGVSVAQYPQAGGIAVSPDGSLLAVANTLNNSVSVFRTSDQSKLFEYDLRPYNTTPGSDGVPGGETIYSVALKGNDTLYAT